MEEEPGAEAEDAVTCCQTEAVAPCPLDPILEEDEESDATDTQTEATPDAAATSVGDGTQEGNVSSQDIDINTGEGPCASWSCGVCTYLHEGQERSFLKCAMCGSFQAAVADLAAHDSGSTSPSAPSQERHIDASSQEVQDQNGT